MSIVIQKVGISPEDVDAVRQYMSQYKLETDSTKADICIKNMIDFIDNLVYTAFLIGEGYGSDGEMI